MGAIMLMTKGVRNLAFAISACAMCAFSSPGFAAVLTAVDDNYVTPENVFLTIPAPGVLSNDLGVLDGNYGCCLSDWPGSRNFGH